MKNSYKFLQCFACLIIILSLISCNISTFNDYPKLEQYDDGTIKYNDCIYYDADLPLDLIVCFSDEPIGRIDFLKGTSLVYPSLDSEQSYLTNDSWVWIKRGKEIPDIYDLTIDSIYIGKYQFTSDENRFKIDLSSKDVSLTDISSKHTGQPNFLETLNCKITVKEYDFLYLSLALCHDEQGNKYIEASEGDVLLKISEEYIHLFDKIL